jgi:alcohol dehydrogenase class IV
MAVSSYPIWVADQKYARAAQFLNLAFDGQNSTTGNKRNGSEVQDKAPYEAGNIALRRAVYDLACAVDQPKSIAELGICVEDFQQALPDLIEVAFPDMSLRTNPNCPLILDIEQLFVESYPPRKRP